MAVWFAVACLAAWCVLDTVSAVPEVCPVKACAQKKSTELEKWECVSDFLFREPDSSRRFVEQQCHGLGWGNSISSLSITVELAALLGARVIFTSERNLGRLWRLPRDFQLDQSHTPRSWSYKVDEKHPEYYGRWIEKISTSDSEFDGFNNTVLQPAICGKDIRVIQLAKCISEALPVFGQCVKDMKSKYFELDTIVNLPAFFAVFRTPTQLMAQYLREIRTRLSLPQLDANQEPSPGAWGLYTPGFYLLAFHYRNIPLGFEPLSVMLNEGHYLESKAADLRAFWSKAAAYAQQAQGIARCRSETLLIYFATDDAANLRPVAERVLGPFGRVLFGLDEGDVGHMRPQWSPDAERKVEDKTAEVLRRRAAGGASCAADAATVTDANGGGGELEGACAGGDAGIHVVSPPRSAEATLRHRDMSLAEWWVLGSAQWLATTRHSSFSNTAAWFGLGPAGRMERFELNARPVPRVDWSAAGPPACRTVGAADPEQARRCPNRFEEA